jgi:hypothetical protein
VAGWLGYLCSKVKFTNSKDGYNNVYNKSFDSSVFKRGLID